MARLAFCDYHNMIAILEKYEHNTDFHQIVDFVEASHLRIETTDEGTKILATVDGTLRTISESSIRRNLQLRDEAGISSLPDAELFENLTLIGYNILPNQKFTFQKGTPTEPHHTPTPEATPSPQHELSSSSLPPATTETIPTDEMALKITAQDLEISQLKARVKLLEDRDGGGIAQSREDAPIKGRSLNEGEEAAIERSTEKGSNDTEEMVNVLTSLDATTVLSSGVSVSISPVTEVFVVEVLAGSGSIPTASPPGIGVPTGSRMVPTASAIFTTATESTPYTRRKGKEKMVESDTPKKK
nr:hypothetical protein [Tanacetum cinerariifolium]